MTTLGQSVFLTADVNYSVC